MSTSTWKNLGLAFLEAMIVLLITQIPIWIGLVVEILRIEGAGISSVFSILSSSFTPGDVLSYAAGILGSSTAYAIMKIGVFRASPIRTIPLITLPMLAIFLALPVYIQDMDGQVANTSFATWYVSGVIVFSLILWINALYQSRAFFDVHLPDSSASDKIRRSIERGE